MHGTHSQSKVTPGVSFNGSLHIGKADHYTPSSYQYHHKSLEASACPHLLTHTVTNRSSANSRH